MKQAAHIDELSGKDLRPKVDQKLLCNRINGLVQADSDEAECELTVLIPLLDTAQVDSVRSLDFHKATQRHRDCLVFSLSRRLR
jgi:hypothetical protein